MFGRNILRKLKKSTPMKEAEKIEYDDQGNAIIEVGLKEIEDFFHPCSFKTYDIISKDVEEYIERFTDQIPAKDDLSVDVYTEEPTDNFDKKRIRHSVKRNYAEKIVTTNKKIKKTAWMGSILLILGIAFAAVEFLIYAIWPQNLVDLIISIVAWTFFWDGFEMLALDLPALREEQIKNYRLMRAKVHVRQYSKTIQREFGIGEFEEDDE